MPALPIVVADEEVEVAHRAHRVEPVGVHGRAAVAHDAGALAVARELARDLLHHGGLDARVGGVFLERPLAHALAQQLEHALHARRLALDLDLGIHQEVGRAVDGVGSHELAVHEHEPRVLGHGLAVGTGFAGAAEHLRRDDGPVRQIDGHEMRRVRPRGLAQRRGRLLAGRRQVTGVVALVREDPRHQGEGQLGILAGHHGQPRVGLRRAAPLARVHHVEPHAALARHRQARSQP